MDCIEMYCVWVNLKNVGPLFVQIIFTVCQFIHASKCHLQYTAGKSFSVVMWP